MQHCAAMLAMAELFQFKWTKDKL